MDSFVPDAGDFDTFLEEVQTATSQPQNGHFDSRSGRLFIQARGNRECEEGIEEAGGGRNYLKYNGVLER